MALNRGKLSDVHRVGAGTSVGIVTVTSNNKIYVKSIICHAAGTGINTATAQVYYWWYFFFEDSLMTTLMPEIVFANIAALIGILTVLTWLVANFVLRRILA